MCATLPGLHGFRWEKPVIQIGLPLQVMLHSPLDAFKMFYLSLVFRSFITLCLGVNFLRFILCGVHSASWIWRCVFVSFGKFSAIIFLSMLLAPLLFTSWDSSDECWIFVIISPAPRPCQSIFTFIKFYWSVLKFTDSILSSPS